MYFLAIVAFVQGLGELLPISSSAHIYLLNHYMKYPQVTQNLDVALHLGSLLAIVCYFHKVLGRLLGDTIKTIVSFKITPGFIGALMFVIATVPAIIAGYFVKRYMQIEQSLLIIGTSFVFFGALALLSEKLNKCNIVKIGLGKAFVIGVAQALAFIPGASRFGLCLTAARTMGVARWQATVFSFVLAIPVLLGALVLSGYDMVKDGTIQNIYQLWPSICIVFVVSLSFLPLLERYLINHTFAPFAIYRILFGLFLLYEAFLIL